MAHAAVTAWVGLYCGKRLAPHVSVIVGLVPSEPLSIKQESDRCRLTLIQKHEYNPSEFWRIVTVALNTGLREAKILAIDWTRLRKR